MPELHELRSHYRTLPDERLWVLAMQEIGDLTPEAVEVLREEIRTRGLSPDLEKVVEAHSRPMGPTELADLVDRFRGAPCSSCGSAETPLNGATIATVRSFAFWSAYSTEFVIACPECIAARAKSATISSLALGWWSIPGGPISTIRAVLANGRAEDTCMQSDPSNELVEFVQANRGRIMLEMRVDR
jgi:hypothetical protein